MNFLIPNRRTNSKDRSSLQIADFFNNRGTCTRRQTYTNNLHWCCSISADVKPKVETYFTCIKHAKLQNSSKGVILFSHLLHIPFFFTVTFRCCSPIQQQSRHFLLLYGGSTTNEARHRSPIVFCFDCVHCALQGKVKTNVTDVTEQTIWFHALP